MLKFIGAHDWSIWYDIVISKHLMLKFICERIKTFTWITEFQNILCWSLSTRLCIIWNRYLLFQNILCWSLSQSSHRKKSAYHISKHLMLKFINRRNGYTRNLRRFQNILCWSLSMQPSSYQSPPIHISKHLMLKFINLTVSHEVKEMLFQNILCWSLS